MCLHGSMGRMSTEEMGKGINPVLSCGTNLQQDKLSLPTNTSNIVNGFSPIVEQAYLLPLTTPGYMTSPLPVYCTTSPLPGYCTTTSFSGLHCSTSSLPVYCSTCTQSELILTPSSICPSLSTSPFSQGTLLVTPGGKSECVSPQISRDSPSMLPPPSIDIIETLSPLSDHVYECHWIKCERQFVHLDDLVCHVNEHHVKVERPDVDYQCKWAGCRRQGRGFNARYKMLIHVRTHTNEKPHKCGECDKSFSRLENLKIHNRSHTGEKPYSCPFTGCFKSYSNSSDRFKHVRTHEEQKPYICKMPGCNKRYTDPSSLRKHVRTHGHQVKVNSRTSVVLKGTNSKSQTKLTEENESLVTLSSVFPSWMPENNCDMSKTVTIITPQTLSVSSAIPGSSLKTTVVVTMVSDIDTSSTTVSDDKKNSAVSTCQEGPLDLSCSPVSMSVSMATFSSSTLD